MGKANLQRKLMCKVLLPMVIGMSLTLLTAYVPFYVSFPSWIDSITNDMINDRRVTLQTICSYLSLAAESAISYPTVFLILASELMKMNYNSTLSIKDPYTPYENSVNARLFQTNSIPTPYGYDSTTNKSFSTGMWYLGDIVAYENINDELSMQEIFNSAVFDFFLRPLVRTGNPSADEVIFQRSLTGFEYDGQVHAVPTEYQSYYETFTENADCSYNLERAVPIYDPRCRQWYIMSKNSTEHNDITITEPYQFADGINIGQTLCAANWDGDTFRLASCLDYSMSQLSSYINVTDTGTTTYAFAVSSKGATFVHPKFNNTCLHTDNSTIQCLSNITVIEMSDATQSEIDYFDKNIVPDFFLSTSSIGEYSVAGEKIIIAISPVFNTVNLNKAVNRVASIGLRLEKRTMTDAFDELKRSLTQLLYIEGVTLTILIIVILVFCWVLTRYVTLQIVKPIDNLVDILDRMMEGDLDINIEEHYQLCSKEITKLYTVFAKLKIVLRFGKSIYFAEDSEAIMNYAQALALFLEFRNMEGVGVCYNNLGIIHYKNNRYHEAIECFAKALEAAESMPNQFELILKRKHMLATTMLAWKRTDSRTPTLMLELIDVYKKNTKDLSKAVECLLLVSEHYIRNTGDSKGYLEEAIDLVSSGNEFKTPIEIFEMKILFCQGLSLAKAGQTREACDSFIDCLMKGSVYDPETRRKCLEELRSIYIENAVPVDYLDYLLSDFKESEKDVVFLIDYSLSMNGIRIQKTQQCISKVINTCIKPRNRIAYILYNKTCNIAFNLIPKGADCSSLIKQIADWDSPKGGTAYYDALALALQEFQAYKFPEENLVPFDKLIPHAAKKRLQWVVALIDGEDNASSIGYGQIKRKLAKSQVSLITVGLSINKALQVSIQELCDVTKKGLYIDCPSLSDLERAFHLVSVVISSRIDDIESLD